MSRQYMNVSSLVEEMFDELVSKEEYISELEKKLEDANDKIKDLENELEDLSK